MRIATYKLRQGGSKLTHWQTMIEDHNVDLMLLQESYSPDQHLPPFLIQVPKERTVWTCGSAKGWGSGIFTSSGTLKQISLPEFEGLVVGAELVGTDWQEQRKTTLVFSIHAPDGTGGYAGRVNAILDMISPFAVEADLIIGGDFNLSVSHWPDSKRATSKKDLLIQHRLAEEFGLMNCWQAANPGIEPAQTLRWTVDPNTLYHCDGLFVPKQWRDKLVRCEVLAGDGWNQLSDHNPVVAEFNSDEHQS